jgi:hypothetical protein
MSESRSDMRIGEKVTNVDLKSTNYISITNHLTEVDGEKEKMVGTTGFEPATSRTPSVRATRLRYVPTGHAASRML